MKKANSDNVVRNRDVQDTESRLQHAASIAELGHYIWDAITDTCLFCSEEHARIHGMSVDEYIAQSSTMNGIAHPDDREAVRAAFTALRRGENFELEYRIVIPSGEVRFIREIGRPVMDEEGVVVQEIGTSQDITKGKRIELELREKENRLRNAQRIARLGSWELGADGSRKNWSEEILGILGFEDASSTPTFPDFNAMLHPEDRIWVLQETERALELNVELDLTYRLECPDGEWRTVHEIAEASAIADSGPLLATVQDITERVRLEEKLNQAQKIEAVGKLTGGIAHDFNNLLGVIQGNAELLAMQDGVNPAFTKAIIAASARGAELTSRLLAFSRRQSLDPRVVNAGDLVAELSLMIDRTLGETIRIETAVDASLWSCLVDPGQLENALLNLAINARDAMPRGGTIAISCDNRQVTAADKVLDIDEEAVLGDFVVITVKDHGKGMSPSELKHAIEPFYTTKREGEGSGLGLSMVYGFLKQTSGHLCIDSEVGGGTSISLYLPKTDAELSESWVDQSDAEQPPKGETVLILEDDPEVLSLVARMARTIGYKTLVASDASGAREILEDEQPFDIVLSDVVIGSDSSGPEFAEEVQSVRPGTPVVFMSGYSYEVAKDRGVLGANSVLLRKPFQRKELASALRRSLDGVS